MSHREMSTEEKIKRFVKTYGPKTEPELGEFVWALREIMNDYAKLAIIHGNLPETGAPHGGIKSDH